MTQAQDSWAETPRRARFSGFAPEYNSYRPSPPLALRAVLLELAMTQRPALVVDLGSGTGLSTRYWAGFASKVIGIEPNPDMRAQALAETSAENILYVDALSHRTGLPDACAEIVTCAQSLHWMEPEQTLTEIARITRPGGVFAAYDYDWPPTTGLWEADAAYEACMQTIVEYEKASPPEKQAHQWPKREHLMRMAKSGCFRYTKEIVLHHEETGDAERLVGLLLSQGSAMSQLKAGHTEAELGIERFRRQCKEYFGSKTTTWYWSARIRIGIV